MTSPPTSLLLLLLATFGSGAASLTLEVLWSRALVVPLGNSTDATSLVLAGFMLGIALGAWAGGRWSQSSCARSSRRLLVAYLGCELGLALAALTLPLALHALSRISAPSAFSETLFLAMGLRWLTALGLVILPCLLMGATLPLLVTALSSSQALRARLGLLYGTNTLGAALGAWWTGFYGLPRFGLYGCSRYATYASLFAALLTLVALRQQVRGAEGLPEPVRSSEPDHRVRARSALLATFTSGFVLFSSEVLWARLLTFVFGHDTYAFASLLGFVLLGLALGGLIYPLLRRFSPERLVAGLMGAYAAVLLLSFFVASEVVIRLGRDPLGWADQALWAGQSTIEVARILSFTPLLLLLPCVVAGIGYPATIAWHAGNGRRGGSSVGTVGLVNGIGGTAGALLTTLLLSGWLGIERSFLALTTLALGISVLLFWVGSARQRGWAIALGTGWVIVVGLFPRDLPKRVLLSVVGPRENQLLHYDEARTATVSVIANSINGERQLLVNAVNEVTTRLVHDQSFKLLGQLGPLLHPDPKQAVMICFGAGLAAGSALTHPLERLDVVDLLGAVREGARHFAVENNGVLDDPRLVLHRNDGRQFLLNSRRRFDLAIIDSTHPKSVDSWILYTREFYQLVRERLVDDGIVVEWLPLHGLSEREFHSVVATFQSVFPEMMLWASVGHESYGHVAYAKLVGQRSGRIQIDLRRLRERLDQPRVQADLVRYGMGEAPEILDQFIAGPERISAITRGAPWLTDDRPFLAYRTELSRGRAMTPDRLIAFREPPWPWLSKPLEPAERAAYERSYDAQGMIVAGDLAHGRAYFPEGEKIRRYLEQAQTSRHFYETTAARYPDDTERLFEAATQLGTFGELESAAAIYERGLSLKPKSFRLALNHALTWLGRERPERALGELGRLARLHPTSAIVHYNLAVALLVQGEVGAAKRELELVLSIDGTHLPSRRRLADVEIRLGHLEQGELLLKAVIREEPFDAEHHFAMGQLDEQLEREPAAEAAYSRAIYYNPYHLPSLMGLARLRARRDPAAGLRDWARLERLFHEEPEVLLGYADELRRAGQYEASSARYEAVLELDPSRGAAALGLGQAFRHQGRLSEAQDALCTALRLKAEPAEIVPELRELGVTVRACEATR